MRGQRTQGTAVGGRPWRTFSWMATVFVVVGVVGHPAKAQDRPLVIRGGDLFDGLGEAVVPNPGIVIRNGRFQSVGTAAGLPESIGAEVIDLADDQTVIPGLIDLHAHYGMTLVGRGRVDECVVNPVIYLANGVTTTFPAGTMDPEGMLRARRRIDRGEQIGPRILNSGPYFGAARSGWENGMTPDELRAEVDRWAERGIRGIKAKGLTPTQMGVILDQARRHGIRVTSHLYNDADYVNTVSVRDAIGMGLDRIEHFVVEPARLLDSTIVPGDPRFDETVRLFLEHQVYFNPTTSVYATYGRNPDPDLFSENWIDERRFFTPHTRELAAQRSEGGETYRRLYRLSRESVRLFYEAGGAHLLTVGSDHPGWGRYLGGFSYHRELLAMVLAGVPEAAVLKAGTINGARAMGIGDVLGSIEVGKLADLVVVAGNPLEDIRNARRVQLVIKAGERFDPEALLESARGRIGPEGIHEHPAWGRDAELDCLERSRQEAAAVTLPPATRTFNAELSGEPSHAPFVPHGNRDVTGQATVTFHTDANTMTWDIRLIGNEFEVTQAHFYNVNPDSRFYEPTGASVFCWGGRWSDHEFLSGQGFPVDPAHIGAIVAHPDDWMLILHTEGGHFANDGSGLVAFDPTVHNTNEIGVDETRMERWFNNRIGKRLGDFTLREPNPHFEAGDRFFEERFGPGYFSRQHDRPFPDAQGNVWLELGEDGEWRLTPGAVAAGYDLETEYLYFRYSDDGPSWDWGGSEGAFGGRLRVEPRE